MSNLFCCNGFISIKNLTTVFILLPNLYLQCYEQFRVNKISWCSVGCLTTPPLSWPLIQTSESDGIQVGSLFCLLKEKLRLCKLLDQTRKDRRDSTHLSLSIESDRVRAHPKKSNSFMRTHFVRQKVSKLATESILNLLLFFSTIFFKSGV